MRYVMARKKNSIDSLIERQQAIQKKIDKSEDTIKKERDNIKRLKHQLIDIKDKSNDVGGTRFATMASEKNITLTEEALAKAIAYLEKEAANAPAPDTKEPTNDSTDKKTVQKAEEQKVEQPSSDSNEQNQPNEQNDGNDKNQPKVQDNTNDNNVEDEDDEDPTPVFGNGNSPF